MEKSPQLFLPSCLMQASLLAFRASYRSKYFQLGSNQSCKLATAPSQHHLLQATHFLLCTIDTTVIILEKLVVIHSKNQPFPTSVYTISLYIFSAFSAFLGNLVPAFFCPLQAFCLHVDGLHNLLVAAGPL